MKKNLKGLAIMLVLLMLASVFTGCGNTKKADSKPGVVDKKEVNETKSNDKKEEGKVSEPVLLKFWGGVPSENGFQEAVDNFNKEYADKGIQVEYTRYVNDDSGNLQLETNLLAGDGVDLFFTYGPERRVKRAESGFALDLTELSERDGYDIVKKMGEGVKNNFVNGKPYSVPTTTGNACMLVNKTMFDEAGVEIPTSWTWDEYREIAKKLSHGEGLDRVYGAYMDNNWLPGILVRAQNSMGSDGNYKNGGKESNFDDPKFEVALQTAVDMMYVDKSTPLYSDVVTQKLGPDTAFLNEKVAMVSTEWIIRYVKDKEKYPHDFITAAVPFPVFDKSETYYSQGGAGDDLMINAKSKNIEAAWTFIKWYADGGMLPITKYGRIPGNKEIDANEAAFLFLGGSEDLFDMESINSFLLGQKENYLANKIDTAAPEINQIMSEEIEAAYMQQKTPKEALADLKERADKKITKDLK